MNKIPFTDIEQNVKKESKKKELKSSKNGKRELEMGGKEWIQNSISVWSDIRKSAEELALKHPALFPQMLASRLINCFSWTGDTVLDPFAGTGSTLLAAQKSGRESVGVELSEAFIKIYHNRLSQLDLFHSNGSCKPQLHHGSCLDLDEYVEDNSVQLTVTSPPYWDILNQKRSADNKEIRTYSDSNNDLGNIKSYEEFLDALKGVFAKVYQATKTGGFCCVNVMDLRKKSKFYPYHIDVVNFMAELNFELDDIIIWDRKQEYNNLRPLGYPYVFRVNKIHEFILIFKKNAS